MKGNLYTVFFSIILGLVCASLLTGVGTLTEKRREANRLAKERGNVLKAFGVDVKQFHSAQDVLDTYARDVHEVQVGTEAEPLTLFQYFPEGGKKMDAVAVRFQGPGLWGPVKGFLALEPDMRTIRGFTVYEQEETPGLGGEIEKEPFAKQFKGKSIVSATGEPGMRLIRPGKSQPTQNEVDALSGATLTCNKVQDMLNKTIDRIIKETSKP